MPFLELENSNYGGSPIYLYEFRRGNIFERLSSSDQDVLAGANTFTSTAITNAGFAQKGEAVTDTVTLDMPDSTQLAAWFAYTPPSDTVYVLIRRFHYGDSESVVVWIGTVTSVDNSAPGKVTANCTQVAVSLKRAGLRLAWQRQCQHALYDGQCKVDKAAHAFNTTISAITAPLIFTTDNPPEGQWFAGGFMEYLIGPDTYERRLIDVWDGNQFLMYGNEDGFTVGQAVTLYPGCQRTSVWCDTVFGNMLNYGGFQYMPNRTLYDGDPVF
jgi:uncharacterized phage protein (TIGR02218 family)